MPANPKIAPRSRRERPSKPALTRDGIIDTALVILRDEGMGKVTMRRIASALDTGPASLYVYVRDTEDLHAQILDALLARMAPATHDGPWRDRLHELLKSYGRLLFDYPEIARMTMTTHPTGPNYASLVERTLGLLGEGGVPDDVAAWSVDLLLASVTAKAVEHGAGQPHGEGTDALPVLAATMATLPEEDYPNITRLADDMLSGTATDRFEWALDVMINGILSTPRPGMQPRG
ncbi:TetR/AcrR family transcriptional regulator [Rathayibacter sp. CAU 1779]